jgi:RNase P subunit RPR2
MPAYADSLYFSKIEQATISDKLLAKTRQQLEEYQAVAIQDITLAPFHKRSEQPLKARSFCTLCHAPLPHQNSVRLRSFLNMHTHYIACETCHFEAKEVKLNYRWLQDEVLPQSSNNQASSQLQPHPMAKISPFFKAEPVSLLPTHVFFQKVENQWEKLSLPEQTELKAKIHYPLTEQGVSCEQCHSNGQNLLDFKQLGASDSQQRAIEQNKIAHFLMRGQDDKKTDKRIRLIDLLR